MKISVIVPTRNRKKLLNNCINSLLNQKFDDYEILIVDDGSTDGTAELVKNTDSRIRYYKSNKRGAGAARNVGISKATGKYIAFTDDDCLVPPDWLSIINEKLSNNNIAVGGPISNGVDKYIANASHMLQFTSWSGTKEMYLNNIPTANIAYKRSVIGSKRFSEQAVSYEDSIFNFELTGRQKKILYCPKLTVVHNNWLENYGVRKFFSIQKRTASGFVNGGHVVHGKLGEFLMKNKIFNILCPNLLYIAISNIRERRLLNFVYHLPLLLAGDLYKSYNIIMH